MKKIWLLALAVCILIAAYFVLHQTSVLPTTVEQPAAVSGTEGTPALYQTPVFERTAAPTSEAQFFVTAVDEMILEADNLSAAEAMSACEGIAYNPAYMWQQVVCTYEGEEIYNDIFIAG